MNYYKSRKDVSAATLPEGTNKGRFSLRKNAPYLIASINLEAIACRLSERAQVAARAAE